MITFKADTLNKDSLLISNTQWLNKNQSHKTRWFSMLLLFSGCFLVYGYRIFRSQKEFLKDEELNKDPEELNELFRQKEIQEKIELLDTPRRIKRFANRLRLQYYLLKEDKVIKTSDDLDILFNVLYSIVENHRISSGTYSEFIIKLKDIDIVYSDKDEFLRRIFNLNRKVRV